MCSVEAAMSAAFRRSAPTLSWAGAERNAGPALISVSTSECTQATLLERESEATITQGENCRCGSIGYGRDPSNSDMTRRERGGLRCEPIGQSCRCQSTTCALRTRRALPRLCLSLNHPRRTSGDLFSSHAPTCFRWHRRRVDPRHAGPKDTGFRQTTRAPRTTRAATCQSGWVKNLHSHPNTISRQTRGVAEFFHAWPGMFRSLVVLDRCL